MTEILIGFFVSLAIAMTGVGAGTVVAPALILFLHTQPAIAIGTALLFALFVKIPVGYIYVRQKMVDWKVLSLMVLGGIPGVIAGAQILGHFSRTPQLEATILGIVGAIVLFSTALNLFFTFHKKETQPSPGKLPWLIPLFTFFIGLEVGFSSAGAGALGTLLLMFTTRLSPRAVVGTDILFGLLLAAAGGGIHLGLGHVSAPLLVKLISGALAGIPLGIYFASKLPARPVKIGLLTWVGLIGTQLIYRSAIILFP